MIISYKLKLIFIHVPKNAGTFFTSIIKQLDPHYIEINSQFDGHQKAKDVKNIFHDYPKYKKVAIIRNTYSRAISFYAYVKQNKKLLPSQDFENYTFEQFLEYIKVTPNFCEKQTEFVLDTDGFLLIDYIISFENIKEDITKLLRKCDIPDTRINSISFQKINASHHDNYMKYYNDKTKELVKEIYQKDIKYFCHSF